MSSPTVDYILGDALMHAHKAGDVSDLTTTLDPRYLKLDQSSAQTITASPIFDWLTASKVVFTTSDKKLTSTGIGTSSQFIKGDGSLDSSTYLTAEADTLASVTGRGATTTTASIFSTSISTPSLISTGAITITPLAGTNLNVSLSTTGDFAVNTNHLYVDTSVGRVGIGTTAPTEELDLVGTFQAKAKSGSDNVWFRGINSAGTTVAQMQEASSVGYGGLLFNGQRNNNTQGNGIFFGGYVGTTASQNNAAIEFRGVGGTIATPADLPTGIPIAKFSSRTGGVIVDRVTIDNLGNVGIGTTNPSSPLQVHGPSTGLVDILKISKAGGSTSYMSVFSNTSNSSNFDPSFLGFHGSGGSAALQFIGGMDAGNDSSGNSPLVSFQARRGGVSGSAVVSRDLFDFNNYGTSVMRINVSGYVGIGTTAPAGRLHINGTADDQQLIVEAHSTQTNNIVEIHDSSSNVLISFNGVGGAVFNEQGSATADFRVESDTEANMLFVDANANTDGSVYLGGTTNGIEIKKGGDLTLLGTAKYERHVQIPAMLDGKVANQPTSEDFFTAGGLQFASAGAQYAYCQWEIPDDWDGTDIVFEIDWFPDSGAISGTDAIRWTVEYRAIAEGELINQGTSVTVDNGVGGDTTDYAQYETKHSRFTLTYNNANQPLTAQDHVYFKISRDTSVANDFAGTVTVAAYEVIYQSKGLPSSN